VPSRTSGRSHGAPRSCSTRRSRHFARRTAPVCSGFLKCGNGGVVAGFGDQREVELLVEAGFTPLEAIHIQTENGATFLGEGAKIGTLKPGKQADITVVKGDPTTAIADIENVEFVFKDGKGYDPKKLIDSVKGLVVQAAPPNR
jgi:hypothetical protein